MNKITDAFLNHRWLRVAIPGLLIVVWLVLGGVGGPTFGKIGDVESNDQSTFLPASAESTKVANIQKEFQASDTIPAVIVITSLKPFQPDDFQSVAAAKSKLSVIHGIASGQPIAGPIPSRDRKAIELIVPIKSSAQMDTVVSDLQHSLDTNLPNSLSAYVTGPAGLLSALIAAFGGIDGVLLLVALGAVFVILLIVYRSILLPIIVLLLDIFALSGAILALYYLAKSGAITLNGQAQGILSILVIGASTDYSLLLVSRYRESLQEFENKWRALFHAIKTSIEPIAASAATVILALLCLLFSDLRSNQALGPVAAIGIAFAFLASMTFLPALLAVFGRAAFWPNRPRYSEYIKQKATRSTTRGLWPRVASFVGRSPRKIWVISSCLLVLATFGLLQLKANGVSNADTILTKSKAITGQKVLAEHYPAGSGTPVVIVAPKNYAQKILGETKKQPGIETATFFSGDNPFSHAQPIVKEGRVLIDATLKTDPGSQSAETTVAQLRNNLHQISSSVLVGGQTATMLDTNNTARTDLYKIIPIVLIVVLIILALLLRALVAPVLLIVSVMLSYAATLGISALVFNHVFHFAGADPAVPLFGFIFLVALGIDYNIFLMSRVREEAKHIATRPAILKGLSVTGGVITSAGIVLAATFAALGVIPILFLAQIAFIVAFGVLLDTIIVRSLIIPAITYDIGQKIWWPSKLSK